MFCNTEKGILGTWSFRNFSQSPNSIFSFSRISKRSFCFLLSNCGCFYVPARRNFNTKTCTSRALSLSLSIHLYSFLCFLYFPPVRTLFLECLQLDLKILYYTLEQQFVFVSCSRRKTAQKESKARASDWTFNRIEWFFLFPSIPTQFFLYWCDSSVQSFIFSHVPLPLATCQGPKDICLTS